MLDVVSKNSDFVIITSDNPRNETFDEITKDMLSNSSDDEIKRYFIVEDREQAIKLGVLSQFKRNPFTSCRKRT